MSLENFNLHMITPEDGGEKDPELKRLKDELFALKAPMEDAVAKQNLPLAEEIFKKIEEAKKRFDDYKESLKKKEYPTIEIGGVQVELGPELGKIYWEEIGIKLEELNKNLKLEEKPWRVPTKEEYELIGEPIVKIILNHGLLTDEKDNKIKEYLNSLDFSDERWFWSDTSDSDDTSAAWYWIANAGIVSLAGKHDQNISVRVIR